MFCCRFVGSVVPVALIDCFFVLLLFCCCLCFHVADLAYVFVALYSYIITILLLLLLLLLLTLLLEFIYRMNCVQSDYFSPT
jgi:hypothetical protein